MEHLAKIMGSAARVKIMRLFLFNEKKSFDNEDVSSRSNVDKLTTRKELTLLEKTGFLKKKTFTKEVTIKTRSKATKPKKPATPRKKKVSGYILNDSFPLVQPLRSLLIDFELVRSKDLTKRLQQSGGRLKLLVLSGIFLKDKDRKVDILIVGDKINKKNLEKTLRIVESEIGKELRYALFDTEEFMYRLNMYDKLLRDIFDYPHERVINKFDIPL